MKVLSESLNTAILAIAADLPYHGDPDAPNSWKDLRTWAERHRIGIDSLPTYDGHSDRTIYGSHVVNVAQRAVHDSHHLGLWVGFDVASECRVAESQCEQAERFGCDQAGLDLLFADVAGQAEYWGRYSSFVDDQAGFVQAYVADRSAALERRW